MHIFALSFHSKWKQTEHIFFARNKYIANILMVGLFSQATAQKPADIEWSFNPTTPHLPFPGFFLSNFAKESSRGGLVWLFVSFSHSVEETV